MEGMGREVRGVGERRESRGRGIRGSRNLFDVEEVGQVRE